ncbi:hypothetical protein [Burkholderia phage FLC8]|nr:hypothetical protein [Burkholderia phage FLC8]
MTYLNMAHRFGGNKNKTPQSTEGQRHRPHTSTFSRGGNNHAAHRPAHRVAPAPLASAADEAAVAEIERIVSEGRQKDLVQFFHGWSRVPHRLGEWDLRVNIRKQDEKEVGRTIVAIPLSVRTRAIFEQGCLATLANAGYSVEDAKRYYKAAWKKKYVWVDSVIAATKEMIDAYQTTAPLESYEEAGDPRRLASTVSVPKNPYQTSHAHFLVAVDMAICIIKARQKAASGESLEAANSEDVSINAA